MDPKELRGLIEAYSEVYASQEVDEAKQPFPAKKVAKQMAKAKAGSVYAKKENPGPVPNTTDAEKKETTRFSKMFHASEKAKREKQNADKARRSSTFYKDTHPASAPKMKKANEELDIFDLVLEFLQAEGYAETLEEAKWMMANILDEEAIAIIVEAMHDEEDDEDEKEVKKGKKSKNSEEDEEDEEDEEELEEASYSAKAARAGRDIGKPGKQFAKIAKEAGKRYGSKERGEKVAGAVLAKLRAKNG
jgi:hypothetical protein